MRHAWLIAPLLVACGSSSGGGVDAADDCTGDPRAETFMINLDHHGISGNMDFVLVSAVPAPPQRPNNSWVIQVNSMASGVVGGPMTGLDIAVTPFMPDHQHGSPIPVGITAMPTAGQYQLSPINTWMPGYWETTVQAASGSTTDSTVFKFCIPI